MSKVEAVRPRHVLVAIEAKNPVSRKEFQDALKTRLAGAGWKGPEVRLTRYAFPHAALNVEHTGAPRLRALLNGTWGAFTVRTLRTSGTLLALGEATGVLTERPPRDGQTRKVVPAGPGAKSRTGTASRNP